MIESVSNEREGNAAIRGLGDHTFSIQNSGTTAILDQTTFTHVLSLERKRAERSGRRFILMLIESSSFRKPRHNDPAFARFLRLLTESTRDTDVKGWYEEGFVFGVIFTDILDADTTHLATLLSRKVAGIGCVALGQDAAKNIRLSVHIFPETDGSPCEGYCFDLKLYPDLLPNSDPKRFARIVKRAIDVAGSAVGLVLLLPLLLAIAFAIKLTSEGPVLFRQKRVGQYGATVDFLKFRSMYAANDDSIHKAYVARFISGAPDQADPSGSTVVFKLKDDPRITPVGRLLRKSSLDELPQLINVLCGQMSLVGPRPPVPYEFAHYKVWHKRRLLKVKPGITGLWQVSGRSRVKFNEMVRLDLRYADSWSVRLDLKILLSTPGAVLSGDGAY
jgi:lipopolysaccharide/colanic/teichoic acid biosynthesis glycosyltransferase